MAKTKRRSYGLGRPLDRYNPFPIEATRAPTTSDVNYDIGQTWVRTDTDQAWLLTSVSSGSAAWTLAGPGASDVDTLTGDSGGAISPAAGNITLAGGTNVTSAGAGSTITFNLDAAITLATSVTSPLYTAAAGSDLDLTVPAGQDCVLKLGDAAGANKFSITDSADSEVFAVDSTGAQTYAGITVAGNFVSNGGTVTLGSDNAANAIIVGGGTTARAITIGQDAAAHTVAIGQAAAGAITIDTAAGVSIDSATASNFTVTGAADLTLDSSAGSVNIAGGEAAADAISIQAAAGGVDLDGALQVNIASAQAAADAVRIDASDASGGIDIDDGGGGTTIDSAGAVSIDAAAASNFSVSGAGIDLTLASAAGRVVVNGEEAATDAIALQSAAGGIDVNAALEINIDSSEAAVADAIRIVASAADGGIDIDAGTGGIAIDSTGALSLDGAAASNFSVSGAGIDLTLASAAGRVVLNGEEAADDAVRILSAAGGLDTDVALQLSLVSSEASADAVVINASAGGMDITAATNDLDVTATAGSVNITAGEAAGDAIVINASNAAGGIDLQAGTGAVSFNTGMVTNVVNKAAADTPYSVLLTDYVIACDTGAGVLTVTLPAAPETGRVYIVCDEGGAAGANNITIGGNGNNISAGGSTAASKVIDSNYGSMYLVYTGTIWTGLDVA